MSAVRPHAAARWLLRIIRSVRARNTVLAFAWCLVSAVPVAEARSNAPLAITRLQPADPDAPPPPASAARIEIKAAVWTPDEQAVVAVVAQAGSDAPETMAVAQWEVASGRLSDWIAFPSQQLGSSAFVKALAIFSIWNDDGLGIALSLSSPMADGQCETKMLSSSLREGEPSDTDGWSTSTDPNTPGSCRASPAQGLVSPSGRFSLAARGDTLVISQPGRIVRLRLVAGLGAVHPPAPIHGRSSAMALQLPRIVLQTRNSAEEPKLATWSHDERRVVALVGAKGSYAPRDMALVVWDPFRDFVANRVPVDPLDGIAELFVHELRVDADAKIEMRGSALTEDGRCETIRLRHHFAQRIPSGHGYDLNRTEDCTPSAAAEPISPSGRFAVDLSGPELRTRRTADRAVLPLAEKPEALILRDAALSPDARTMALLGEQADGGQRTMLLLALTSSRLDAFPIQPAEGGLDRIGWREDGRAVLERHINAGSAPDDHALSRPRILLEADNGATRLEYDPADGEVERISDGDGRVFRTVVLQNIVAGGVLPDAPVAWVATRDGRLVWFDRQSMGADVDNLTTVRFLPDGKFFATSRFAYDTNLPADTKLFSWTDQVDGFGILEPQSYMRLAFVPQLLRKTLACIRTGECDSRQFGALPRMNLALPGVWIESIKAGSQPDTVDVSVVLSRGRRTTTSGERSVSGAYNLRLFRDGALVAQFPRLSDAENPQLAEWRAQNRIALGPDGTARVTLTVALPTPRQAREVEISAYAFNEDRVKSETASIPFVLPPAAAPRPRRAYVVAIGIDDYDEPRLRLRYAANDARLLGERLGRIPGFDVRRTVLAGTVGGDRSLKVTAAMVALVFDVLSGRDPGARGKLGALGVDASQLDRATPDDIVIVSFSGHGWAEPGGFYLLPANARWPEGAGPDRATLVSAAQMADRMRDIDAGEIALIIDACHSAASVDSGGFRPGPMGDPGLGQLAFDKGIRILAATQASDVALEDARLRQGLLTYALAGEGITADGGQADADGDGRIMLDEWLRYATRRMPALSRDLRVSRIAADPATLRGWVRAGPRPVPPVQEPALFDFNSRPSMIVLREGIGR